MAPINASIEIDRPPQEVFDYLGELDKHSEWQEGLEKIEVETPGPTRVGSRARETRKVPGGSRTFTYEMTELDAPASAAFRVVDGPLRAYGRARLTPLDGGTRTRYEFEMNFETHGLTGKLFGPLARRDAVKQVPRDLENLKKRLES